MIKSRSLSGRWFLIKAHIKQLLIAFVLSVLALAATLFLDFPLIIAIASGISFLILCSICTLVPVWGFYICFISCFFLLLPDRILNHNAVLPTGLIPELLTYATMGGYLLQQKLGQSFPSKLFREPVFLFSAGLIGFYFLQFFNPNQESSFGWFNFIRKQVSHLAFIYVAYCYFSNSSRFRKFTRFWIVIAAIHVLYTCFQQWFGFFDFEWAWIISDPERYALFVQDGLKRKFGLVSDPASAGILYSFSALIMLILTLNSNKKPEKTVLALLAVLSLLASGYTGTRTGYLMIIAGFFFYLLLTLYERRTIFISAGFALALGVVFLVPAGNNPLLNRVLTLIKGTGDPSAGVREINRKKVQPYVHENPFGGGLNSSGMNGKRYAPFHYLSSVPPDSGYLQVMMEQGYIGLAMLMVLYFMILYLGIRQFYRIRDPELRTITAVHLVAIFSLMVAQISQMAIGQYPTVLYFYAAIAFLMRANEADKMPGSENMDGIKQTYNQSR